MHSSRNYLEFFAHGTICKCKGEKEERESYYYDLSHKMPRGEAHFEIPLS